MSLVEFFAGKRILLTGATGMLGKALAEKILRDLPDVGALILLVRSDEKASASDRVAREIVDGDLFDRLRGELGADFSERISAKIRVLSGDLRQPDLGLGREGYASLCREADGVINCAASVKFDESLDAALATNVAGVSRLLEFARDAGAFFVQVSTAYATRRNDGEVAEDLEVSGSSLEDELTELNELANREVSRLVQAGREVARRRGWIDVYTYSKHLGERVIFERAGDVRCAIVRPSIIESTLVDPLPGWIEGLRMADPVFVATGRGLTSFPMVPDAVIDLIPLDFVVRATLSACRAAAGNDGCPLFFHAASGDSNPLMQNRMIADVLSFYAERAGAAAGFPRWTSPPIDRFRTRLARRIRRLERLVGWTKPLEGSRWFRRMRRRLRHRLHVAKGVQRLLSHYGDYLQLRCRFRTESTAALHAALLPWEVERFGFDPTEIDWTEYLCGIHLPTLWKGRGAGIGGALFKEAALSQEAIPLQMDTRSSPDRRAARLFRSVSPG